MFRCLSIEFGPSRNDHMVPAIGFFLQKYCCVRGRVADRSCMKIPQAFRHVGQRNYFRESRGQACNDPCRCLGRCNNRVPGIDTTPGRVSERVGMLGST